MSPEFHTRLQVDLIICYDVSTSATRQTQRYGRTGRRNAGKVAILLTTGLDEELYVRCPSIELKAPISLT